MKIQEKQIHYFYSIWFNQAFILQVSTNKRRKK